MTILIPTDSDKRHECVISSTEENNAWAYIVLEEGQISLCEFYESRQDIIEWIDFVVVLNIEENFWKYCHHNVKVLAVNNEKSIDEIVESFLLDKLKIIKR